MGTHYNLYTSVYCTCVRTRVLLKGHDHNVSAYSRRSVNAWGVVNFASTVCTYYPGQSTFPNPSEQKPNQTNKRLVCSYTTQRQQQKLGSCYFELFCNELSSIMTRMVATHPRSRTLHLRLLHGSSWTKLKALCFHGKALFLFNL